MPDGIQPTMEDDPLSPTGDVDANNSSSNNSNSSNSNNNKATNQTEPSFSLLPPPNNMSGDEIDRLLNALTLSSDCSTGEKASPPSRSSPPKLTGREVLIPAFGTSVAFFEGELRPEQPNGTNKQKDDEKDDDEKDEEKDDDDDDDEERVYISTAPKTNRVAGGASGENQKKSDPLPKEEEDGDMVSMSFSDALEWLRKHSSSSAESGDGSTTARNGKPARKESSSSSPGPTTKATATPTPKPAVAVATAAAAAVGKPNPNSNSNPPTAKPTARASTNTNANTNTNTTTNTERGRMDDEPPSTMFNINEEYDARGNRVFAEAVDLSSRLQAVYGDASPGRSDTYSSEEEKSRGIDHDSGPSTDAYANANANANTEETKAETKPKTTVVSEEEYDRISRRLEELALMEEEELKREKEMRSSPKALGRTSRKTKTKTTASSSSFGFKKGFLNSPKKSSAKKKSPPEVSKSKATNTTVTPTATPTPTPSDPPLDAVPKKSSGGVTINTDNNKIHEIPREGRQQPLPKRRIAQQPQPRMDSAHNATVSSTRLLDSSVFSGQISERSAVPTPTAAAVAISSDTAARLAANEQTQSLQHELAQQERQRSSKPTRVSRFKQQRQHEQGQGQGQGQQPKRVSRFKQQQRQQGH